VDPEPETVDVLALVKGQFELVMHGAAGQRAASRLLPGFELALNDLFHGACSF
jgi:hypothetical protein